MGEADKDNYGMIEVNNGFRAEWRNIIELNKIIYQDVVAKNPC
jgi:hypothetical protein